MANELVRGGIAAATPEAIAQAADLLRAGDLVGLPTETVYGLAADALNPEAARRIFAAKDRPADHPLIVHLPDAEQLPRWASSIPKEAIALARAFWPGPLTMILKRDPGVPDEVTGGQDTVGLRVPAHPVAQALLKAFDSGIAAPSANRFGRISPTTAAHVQQELGERVAMILDGGACEVGIESTIIDLSRSTPEILRPGAITADQIAAVIGRQPRVRSDAAQATEPASAEETAPRVSGALAAHYAPRTPLRLVEAPALAGEWAQSLAAGLRVAVLARTLAKPEQGSVHWRQAPLDAAAYAHDLYATLRDLDAAGADLLLVEALPPTAEWRAVRDRLGRAAAGSGEQDET